MKKYYPILAFLIAFTGFLSSQVFFDVFQPTAGTSKKSSKLNAHYESKLKKSVFKTFKGDILELAKDKTPIIILNFWASWCVPCLEEFPSLVEMREKFSEKDVLILAINSDDEEQIKNIKKIKKKYKLNFPIIPDKEGKILQDYLISAIPVSIIFHKGKVVEVSNGAKDFSSEETYEKINSLLGK